MTETLLDELTDEIEDERTERTVRALGDVRQMHLSARWWS
jgi:hypothetical protein